MIDLMSRANAQGSYAGLKEHILPLYVDYFGSTIGDDDSLRVDCALAALRTICEALIFEDRIEKILPFLLDLLKDDTDEEKRCSGL